jgi:hypothetical protein
MPGGELETAGRPGPALAEVAAEMSEIFVRAGVGQPAPAVRRPAAVAALRPSRPGGPTATLLTATAAGLMGLGAGAFVVHTPGPVTPADARVAAEPQSKAKPQPPSQASAPLVLAQAAPALAVSAPPVSAPPVSAPEVAPKTALVSKAPANHAKATARARFRTKLAKLGGPRSASARTPIRLGVPVARPASCEQDAEGEDCRLAVVQADRHLRAVYESAFQRGVSQRVLVGYRDRWSDLRERNTDDPTTLIESYGALAYDLARENPDDQDAGPRPKGRTGLKALADLLLPWR